MDRSEVHQFLRINDFGVEPKTGPHYLTIAHTSSAAARLQLFPFKPGSLFVVKASSRDPTDTPAGVSTDTIVDYVTTKNWKA